MCLLMFKVSNNFILKEIGIVFEKDPKLNNSCLIEPHYDFILLNTKSRKTAIWLTDTHHNIFWNDGENSFPQTRKYLRTITSCLFDNGERVLEYYLDNTQRPNLESYHFKVVTDLH